MKRTIIISAVATGFLFLATLVISCNHASKSNYNVKPATRKSGVTARVTSLPDPSNSYDGPFVPIGLYTGQFTPDYRGGYSCASAYTICHVGHIIYAGSFNPYTTDDNYYKGLNVDPNSSPALYQGVLAFTYDHDLSQEVAVMMVDTTKISNDNKPYYRDGTFHQSSEFALDDSTIAQCISAGVFSTSDSVHFVSGKDFDLSYDGNIAWYEIPASSFTK